MLRRAILSVYEFYLLLRAAPGYAERYKKQTIIVTVFGVIWLITKFAGVPWFEKDPLTRELVGYASRTSFVISVLATGWAFLTLLAGRFPLDEIVCREVSVDAHYYPPNQRKYDVIELSKCINRTDGPIREFTTFRDGYWTALESWNVSAELIASESHTSAHVEMSDASTHDVRSLPGGATIHWYRRIAIFNPSLAAGDYCTVECKIEALGEVETEAFNDTGTEFARGVSFNTLVYKIAIHAPNGYKIAFKDARVLNADHEEDSSETQRQAKAKLRKGQTLLKWRVTLARKALKYSLRYHFVPEF